MSTTEPLVGLAKSAVGGTMSMCVTVKLSLAGLLGFPALSGKLPWTKFTVTAPAVKLPVYV